MESGLCMVQYTYLICMGPSILSVIAKRPAYSGPSYPSSPVVKIIMIIIIIITMIKIMIIIIIIVNLVIIVITKIVMIIMKNMITIMIMIFCFHIADGVVALDKPYGLPSHGTISNSLWGLLI